MVKRSLAVVIVLLLMLTNPVMLDLFSLKVYAANEDETDVIGTYVGKYQSSVERDATLVISHCDSNGAFSGVFSLVSAGAIGSYNVSGNVNFTSRDISFHGTTWIIQPSTISLGSFSGKINFGLGRIEGIIDNNPNYTFAFDYVSTNAITQLTPQTMPLVWSGEYISERNSRLTRIKYGITIQSIEADGSLTGIAITTGAEGESYQENSVYEIIGTIDFISSVIWFTGTKYIVFPTDGLNHQFVSATAKIDLNTQTMSGFVGYNASNPINMAVADSIFAAGNTRSTMATNSLSFAVYENKKDMTSSTDDYTLSSQAEVEFNGKTYKTSKSGTVTIALKDSTSKVVTIKKEGYFDKKIDISDLLKTKILYLERNNVKTPVVHEVTIQSKNIRHKTFTAVPQQQYDIRVNIDWNGLKEKTVYIEQGISQIPVKDGVTGPVDVARLLGSSQKTYLIVKATNGISIKKQLKVNVSDNLLNGKKYEASFGDNLTNIAGDMIPYLDNMSFDLSLPAIPLEFSISGNTVRAVIGVNVAEYKKQLTLAGAGTEKVDDDPVFKNLVDLMKDTKEQLKTGGDGWKKKFEDLNKAMYFSGKDYTVKYGVDAKAKVAGYFEFTLDQNGIYLKDAGAFFSASLKKGFGGNFFLAPIPIPFYWEAYVKGEIEAQLGFISKELRSDGVTTKGTISGKAALGAGAGAGIPGALSGGLVGEGALKPKLELGSSIAFTLDLDLSLKIKLTFAIWDKKIDLWGETYHIYPQRTRSLGVEAQSTALDDSDFELIDRFYLSEGSYFLANEVKMAMQSEASFTWTTDTFKTNTFSYPSPALLDLGNGQRLMVWLDDNGDASNTNYLRLMFSHFDGTLWSEPAFVWDDGTSDSAPTLKLIDGRAYVVWENMNAALPEDLDIGDVGKYMEIGFAEFDPTTAQFVNQSNVSADTALDMMPSISAYGDNLAVTWVRADSGDLFSDHYVVRRVASATDIVLDDGEGAEEPPQTGQGGYVWFDTETLTDLLYCVDSLDTAYIGDEHIIAFTSDHDDDITTSNDTDLYILRNKTLTRITDNDVPDTKPQITANGQLYWYHGGALAYLSSPQSTELQYLENISLSTDRFRILENKTGNQVYFAFAEAEGAYGDVFGYIYNKSGDYWSEKVQLSEIGGYVDSFSGYVDGGGTAHLAIAKMNVTGNMETEEGINNLFGSTDILLSTSSPMLNLSVSSDAYYDAEKLMPGYLLPITFNVKNNGSERISGLTVDIQLKDGSVISSQELTDILVPGEEKEVSVNYGIAEDFNPKELTIVVRPKTGTDVDLNDNSVSVLLDYHDICIDSVEYGVCNDETLSISAVVSNRGFAPLSDISVRLIEDTPDGTVLETITIDSLDSLETTIVAFEGVEPNKCYYVIADIQDDESMMGNNSSFVYTTVEEASEEPPQDAFTVSFPDTVVVQRDGLSLRPGEAILVGDRLTITAVVPEGYLLKSLAVNTEPIRNGSTFEVETEEDIVISVIFTEIQPIDDMQSAHPYDNNMDESWNYSYPGASKLLVTFSQDTLVESNYDFLYIYDGSGTQTGKYTGSALAGKTIEVAGDSFRIRLTSDHTQTKYGFRITDIVAIPAVPSDSISLSESQLNLYAGETYQLRTQLLPDNSTDDVAWETSNTKIANVRNGLVTAKNEGAAVITATTTSGQQATCEIEVSVKPLSVKIEPSVLELPLGSSPYQLTAEIYPAQANQSVVWQSDDSNIATVNENGLVSPVSEGTTRIVATTADETISGSCQVTVVRLHGSIALNRTRFVSLNRSAVTLKATLSAPGTKLKYTLKDAITYSEVDWQSKLSIDDTTPAVNGVQTITITPKAGSDGSYILRAAYANSVLSNAWAECRIDIATTPLDGDLDYPVYKLDPVSVTVSKKQTLNATAAQIGLWPNADAATPVSLMSTGVKVQFKGGDANPNNAFFAFIPSDENTVDVQIKSITGIGKKYQDELEIILPNDDPVTIEGKLTINVTDKSPTLKATAVTVNTFYDDRTAELLITGGMVEQLKESSSNRLAWAGIDETASDWTVKVDDTPSKGSGTLKLDAKLTGWEGWYPVNVKVNRTYVPPALKLASNKISLYMSTTRAMDNTLVLQPKNSGTTLADLGITRVDVDSAKASIFSVNDQSFDIRTGKFVIHADRAKPESQLKGTLPLLVSVKGASKYKVKLNASVSLVKSNAAIKLKANKTTVTLNPNLMTGESYNISLSTNVAGFDLASWHDQNPIGVQVFDSADKAKVKTNVNGQPGKITASVGDDGNTLTVSVGKSADFGKTYKVLLTLPNVNDNKPVSPTLTLTIKTTKESTSTVVTSKNHYGAKGTISVKGKMDLSTGTRATITAKLTNYNGGVLGGDLNNSIPDFEITPPKTVSNTAWGPNSDEYKDNFLFRRVSPTSWTVELKKGGSLVPGTYTIAMKTGYINDIDSISTKAVRFTVSAAKPKVTLSTKKVTLYNNDPGSRGVVTLTLPNGYADITNVTLKGAKLADGKTDNPSFAYKIQQLDSNTYAIMLDQSKNAAVLDNVEKSASVTLEVWLVGNDNTKSVATAKVTVAVNKGH
ncbi:Ig-like domain-containing protein [Ruminococcaceae bacterium OttesenSCG-928-A11]|nr:Ig-like domain-containing protein [Ruminococcaceae bacterium OttesenSCG-928-A11]